MDETIKAVVALMLEHGGLWAAAVIILGLALWRIFGLLMQSQESRITENREAVQAISDNARALESLAEVIKAGRRGS